MRKGTVLCSARTGEMPKKMAGNGCRGGKRLQMGIVPCSLIQKWGCFKTAPPSVPSWRKEKTNAYSCVKAWRRRLLPKRKAKVIGLQINPIPVFRFFKTQPGSSNLYLQLTPLFQFFLIQSCKLGGQKPSCGRKFFFFRQNFNFLIRCSNMNILNFWYRNQAIQKIKFIYTCRTTTFTRDLRWDKIVLQNRIGPNLEQKKLWQRQN